jgi:hypothetical protein
MLSSRKRVVAMIGAAVLAAILPASAAMASTAAPAQGHASHTIVGPAIPAIPYTYTACNPNPLELANECTTVVGTGLYVDSISGVTFSNVYYDLTKVHIQIYGPHGTIHNCSAFTLHGLGKGPVCLWVNPHPATHVTAGDYCSKAWQQVGSGYVGLSAECVNVHK